MKECSCCKLIKNLSAFYRQKDSNDGLRSMCKECFKARVKNYRANHKEQKKQYDAEYLKKNRKAILSKQLEYYRKRRKSKPWTGSHSSARTRCTNPNRENFHSYGGRGIKFLLTHKDCDLMWNRDFAFLMKRPSLDRIDNNGNYEIGNCRFIEMSENAKKGNNLALHLTDRESEGKVTTVTV